ncbi:MAG: membrane or secreted protein [Pirellulaceae bacterium]
MTGRFMLLVAVCMLATTTGCRTMWPQWFNPGNIQTQRYNATLHDPYPNVNEGPEVVGGRPREYQQPLAEPRANQLQQERVWQSYP